eukprot:TRINITY_DN18060_c0_g1_i1.p1 TRINITY_DN18060_c0_g1~~TRINITY_DN18060_c0_g1_i1.p1  ORF type:complete len:411 (+),score=67.20 TRINITY_DN18060_c0_g1_i1:172-1233(+)
MGWVDMGYLLAYAGGQIPAGLVVDMYGPKAVLVVGLIGSGLMSLWFAWTRSVNVMMLLFVLNGLCQATGWPASTKVMAKQFPAETRTKFMAVWSTNYQIGGVIGTSLAGYLTAMYAWQTAFTVPAFILITIGALTIVYLPTADPASPTFVHEPTTFADVVRLLHNPLILRYGVSYFFIKYIRYAFLFWLPFYLQTAMSMPEDTAAYVSTSLEIGGAIGVIIIGFLPLSHATSCAIHLTALSFWLAVYPHLVGENWAVIVPLLATIGFFLYAPDSLIVGAAGQSLGGHHAAASACSTINALGSLGAFVQSLATPYIMQQMGWGFLFYMFSVLAMVSAVILATAPNERSKYSALP